ncbi:MAG: DUF2232 domain-containing protein [Vulcanibacillus sp.]
MTKNKNLTENTLASLIYLTLLITTLYTPFGLFTFFILSGPFIFVALRNENKVFLIVIIINLLASILIGSIVALFLSILAGSVGFTMGRYYKRISLLGTMLSGIIVVIINIVVLLFIGNMFFDVNISNTFNEMMRISFDSTERILNNLGDEQQTEQLIRQYKEFLEIASLLIPFIFIVLASLYVTINHLVASIILNKLGFEIPKLPRFRNWKFPRSIIYYYFIVAIIYLINPSNYSLKVIVTNLFPLLTIILLIQGLSFIFYYSYYKKFGKVISIIAVISIFIPILNQVVQIIGIIDLSFNLRKSLAGIEKL